MPKAGRGGGGGGVFQGTGFYADLSTEALIRGDTINREGIAMDEREFDERVGQISALESEIEGLEQSIAGMHRNFASDDPVVDIKDIREFEDDLSELHRDLDFRNFQRNLARDQQREGVQRQLEIDAEMRRRGL